MWIGLISVQVRFLSAINDPMLPHKVINVCLWYCFDWEMAEIINFGCKTWTENSDHSEHFCFVYLCCLHCQLTHTYKMFTWSVQRVDVLPELRFLCLLIVLFIDILILSVLNLPRICKNVLLFGKYCHVLTINKNLNHNKPCFFFFTFTSGAKISLSVWKK